MAIFCFMYYCKNLSYYISVWQNYPTHTIIPRNFIVFQNFSTIVFIPEGTKGLKITFNIATQSYFFKVSGLVLCGLSIWTYVVHEPFLAIIPNVTYKIIVYLTFATGSFICLTSLVGLLTTKHNWKSSTSIVSSRE